MSEKSNSITPPNAFDIFLILFCSLIWSSAFVSIKMAVVEIQPVMIALSRVSIGFIFLISYILILPLLHKKSNWPTGKRNWVILIIVSLLYTTIPFSLIGWGQQYISATLTSLLMGSSPLVGYIIAHFATKDEKLTPLKLLSLILGFCGIMIALNPFGTTDIQSDLWGVLAIIGGIICYSISGILTRKIDNGDSQNLSAAVLGIGTICLIPSVLISGQWPSDFSSLSNDAIYSVIYLGLFPTGLAYLIRFYLIIKIGYTAFLTSIFFIPVFGVFLSAFILDEALTLSIFIALGFIVASLFISRMASKKAIAPKLPRR